MALKVIGTGWGRTGTLSLKLALEQLGFGPCHHMVEVFGRPETAALWVAAAEGRPDWEAIFQGYASMTDYPGVNYWRELIARYPDARVVHTMRDPDSWFESAKATVFSAQSPAHSPPPMMARFFETMMGALPADQGDRATMIEMFNRHNAEVMATVPKERMLVYEVKQGWGPLCAFLGVAEPEAPFPRENSRTDFAARLEHGPGPDPAAIRRFVTGGQSAS
jgi:hypothetical protein